MRHRATPEIVDFAARDGFGLNFHHYPNVGAGHAGPVIVVHGPPRCPARSRKPGRFILCLRTNHIGSMR